MYVVHKIDHRDVCTKPKYESVSPSDLYLWMCMLMSSIVQNFPIGFPKVSCFMDSDDSFMVYRRFGTIFSRLLLSKQDELRCLEAKLNGMDKTDETDDNTRYLVSREVDADRDSLPATFRGESRAQLLEKIEKKAMEYGKRQLRSQKPKQQELTAPSRPPPQSSATQGPRAAVQSRLQKRLTLHGERRWSSR